MAWEATGPYITLPQTTGLRRGRFVAVNTAGKLVYPALGDFKVIGVLVSEGTTGSATTPKRGGTVQIQGVAKVEAAGGTLARGAVVQSSSVGRAKASTAGAFAVGTCVAGTSGSTNRMLSVLLNFGGTT